MRNFSRMAPIAAAIAAIAVGTVYCFRPSPFKSACLERLKDKKYEKNIQIGLCDVLERRFFLTRKPIQEITPETVQAPSLPIDHKVRFVAFYDPAFLSSYAYCYFAFRGWFNPKDMSPQQISLAASGFAILKSELAGYPDWLKTDKGRDCVRSLRSSIKLGATDLAKEMGDNLSIIAFNPIGAIRSDDGLEAVLKEALLTINHERIHAIHVSCPAVDVAASKYWGSLTTSDKKKLKEGHLNYDWSNRVVAVREAFAYAYEENPGKVLRYIGKCSF